MSRTETKIKPSYPVQMKRVSLQKTRNSLAIQFVLSTFLDRPMSRNSRIQRPRGEVKQELVEQLQMLRHLCAVYDQGVEPAGKDIATKLRLLLHDTQQGRSRSLLDQLGLRSGRFWDSAGEITKNHITPACTLLANQITDSGGRYVPLVATRFNDAMKQIPFAAWWNVTILEDNLNHRFSRRDLVLHVADTDGGAHVDPNLDSAYMALSRSNSLGLTFVTGSSLEEIMARPATQENFQGRPELACMRQIAYEVLRTIDNRAPEFRSDLGSA